MRIRAQIGPLGERAPVEAGYVQSLVVSTADGSPVAGFIELNGKIVMQVAGEAGFARLLTSLGYRPEQIPAVETHSI